MHHFPPVPAHAARALGALRAALPHLVLAAAAEDAEPCSPLASLGLGAFLRPHPLERLCRDLGTYLRQPGPDRALTEAAGFILDAPAEPGAMWDDAP